jgi:hypothetical protein
MIRAVSLVVILVIGLMAAAAQADRVTGSGEQIRGVGGRNGQLIGKPFTLAKASKLVAVRCSGDGFWIEGGGGVRRFPRSLPEYPKGIVIAAGTYRVFPNLRVGQDRAAVVIQLTN